MNFIEMETAQKLRGGYYTPLDLATFLVRWVNEIRPATILEPSCGDGAFFQAIACAGGLQDSQLLGFELDPDEAERARARSVSLGLNSARVTCGDFLLWALNSLTERDSLFSGGPSVDAIVGNPPFIRYQYLPEPFQVRAAQVFKKLDLPFTKHTNSWVPFVLASAALLRPGGRLAMVLPAELIHVTHAQSLRSYLRKEFRRIVLIDPEEIWFSQTLQGAVILLGEKRHSSSEASEGVGIYPVKGREFLELDPATVFKSPEAVSGNSSEGKWTRVLLDRRTRSVLDTIAACKGVHRFDEIAHVDVGIVTGANKFFLVPDDVVSRYRLQKWAHPMFGRSEHCPGIIYDHEQHLANITKGNPTNFLWFHESAPRVEQGAEDYIKLGESQNIHTRYKCRMRSPWYSVPSVYATEIGMLKRSHDTPRLILNNIGAFTTDTAYRIRSLEVPKETLVGCFVNPLTALSAEVEGRHYGGGVLELIPSEIERLLVPLPQDVRVDPKILDCDIRNLTTHRVLARQSKIVLGALGISESDQETILEGWRVLRDRRQRSTSQPLGSEDQLPFDIT
ncbi:MAG TPA: N-6 DNA methylase [Chthonomonadaceae bacterium]|nr:N-6 DNA methylase [Chthonomonadaceae bacterium]